MESKDQALGSLLDRLGGSIHGTALHISPTQVCAQEHLAVHLLKLSAYINRLCVWNNSRLCTCSSRLRLATGCVLTSTL
jgi:hypothetical protein